ncbi:pre-mRNA-splicing factor CWC25 homolog [Helicoverpa zea]|uniref:pre-mRNA-splicing factor CWC25 homolog n=1 Tax=Helicoverpa zea TaxID=7113 RepID=UPI001F56A58A|nr:pre-mRNA-splicing factor CWC25 homolog [Helicoverpa zea]
MGGGDLNSKKSWHPNTMKNQERVWKAEQAAAEEKKKMLELQRERAEERDRAELNSLLKHSNSSSVDDNRLSWMYDRPDKKVDQEAYLLGKSIDKNADISDKPEQDVIPAVSRRVVGSSMLTAAGDAQVDMSRKIREDPLLLIKERERAARAALLNNPLQRRRLAELLRKEQDLKKESKSKKSPKKKDKNLDDLLAAKLNALGGQKSLDLATLLDSDDSSGESSPDRKRQSKKKKKKAKHSKKKKKKKSKYSSESSSEDEPKHKIKESRNDDSKSSKESFDHRATKSESRKRKSSGDDNKSDNDVVLQKKYKKDFTEPHVPKREYENQYKGSRRYNDEKNYSGGNHSRSQYNRYDESHNRLENKRRGGMTEEEKAVRLAEMAAAGAEREVQRGRRVAAQRAADAAAERAPPATRAAPSAARALPDSLESRIHSNRHYIQRDKRHMNEHFARR